MVAARKLVALGAVLAVAASGIALAETTPAGHPRGSDHQQTMQLGQPPTAQYAGQQKRAIKALSEADIAALRAGDGMGLAKAAELNGYPGPKHVLMLAKELQLNDAQRRQIQAIFDRMHAAAVPLGAEIIDRERNLDQHFAGGDLAATRLDEETAAIAGLEGRLRSVHLAAHLETRPLLNPEQLAIYQRLRGYGGSGHSHHHG